ncbi:MAG: DUF2480 family protein [Flavobacteriaceae bacterium]|mgnify:FL=1|jgi:hypothetical protein|nr:DUF2480 family protein [Flavobacteriaceae bacterium]MDG1793590.1 DUF2480 family protein [Flavobacteriaceae bacterium]
MKTGEIVNRVANSVLVTIDLEEYYPSGERILFDIKDWLYEGLVLREKEFRALIDAHDWSIYKNQYIALHCTSDAIIPGWAYMLIRLQLSGIAKQVVVGNLETLETTLYQKIIANLELDYCANKPVIIKGCSNKPVPQNAYLFLIDKLYPIAKSILYGEACSSVPLYKKK